jgi:hypothetical protein
LDGLHFTLRVNRIKSGIDLTHPSINGNRDVLSSHRRGLPRHRRQRINHQQGTTECPTQPLGDSTGDPQAGEPARPSAERNCIERTAGNFVIGE